MADSAKPMADAGWRHLRVSITPNVWAMGVVSLLNHASTEMVYPHLPLMGGSYRGIFWGWPASPRRSVSWSSWPACGRSSLPKSLRRAGRSSPFVHTIHGSRDSCSS